MNRKEEANMFVLVMVGLFVLLLCTMALRGWGLLYGWDFFNQEEPITLLGCAMGTGMIVVVIGTLLWGGWPTIKELWGKK